MALDPNNVGDTLLIDLVSTIADECGAWNRQLRNKQEDPWTRLSLSLDVLAANIRALSLQAEGNLGNQSESLLELEDAASHVRFDCDSLSSFMEDRSELMEMCDELDSLLHKRNDLTSLSSVCRSIIWSIHQQTFMAQEVLKSIERNLAEIHSSRSFGTEEDTLSGALRKQAHVLRKKCLEIEHQPWTTVFTFLSQLQSDSCQFEILEQKQDSKKLNRPCAFTINYLKDEHHVVSNTQRTEDLQLSCISEIILPFIGHGQTCESDLPTSLLLIGPEGSGKTHICDEIQKLASPYSQVLRPSLQFDMAGSTVGASENLVLALFNFALSSGTKRCIILLDDVELIIGKEQTDPLLSTTLFSGSAISHPSVRIRSAFLSGLDALSSAKCRSPTQILVVCTSTLPLNEMRERFDCVQFLTPPNECLRRHLILPFLGLSDIDHGQENTMSCLNPIEEGLLSDVVTCSVGMTYAELSQYCRHAVESSWNDSEGDVSSSLLSSSTDRLQILHHLKHLLQSSLPQSLRQGANDDFVDLAIFAARDLLALSNEGKSSANEKSIELPLFGESFEVAWKDLERLIVLPLCRAKALQRLLYGDHQGGGTGGKAKVTCGGVLLTGPPGCGKTTIAYHCAKVAASLLPSIKLVDVSCTSLVHKEVGGSERAIHKLFECAREAAPCILLMDGIENIAPVRGNDNTTEGTMDRVLSTLLTELDGVDDQHGNSSSSSSSIAVIGITHNVSWIDPALRRPGRLEKVIRLGYPDYNARRCIVLREFADTPFQHPSSSSSCCSSEGLSLEALAEVVANQTDGMTGARVMATCSEAKMKCARDVFDSNESPQLQLEHFLNVSVYGRQ